MPWFCMCVICQIPTSCGKHNDALIARKPKCWLIFCIWLNRKFSKRQNKMSPPFKYNIHIQVLTLYVSEYGIACRASTYKPLLLKVILLVTYEVVIYVCFTVYWLQYAVVRSNCLGIFLYACMGPSTVVMVPFIIHYSCQHQLFSLYIALSIPCDHFSPKTWKQYEISFRKICGSTSHVGYFISSNTD